jgi:hypothetical protein
MADNDIENEERVRSYLADHGGSVEDAGGRGLTDEMARAIGVDKPAALSAILGRMESDGVITRDMRGLRTYRISLTGSDEPALVAAEPGPARAESGGGSRTVGRGGRSVSLRDAVPEPAPTDAPESPRAAVSLREALSRRPAVVEPAVVEPAAVEGALATAGAAAAQSSDQAPAQAVSLRDAIKRMVPGASSPPPAAPVSGAASARRAAPPEGAVAHAAPAPPRRGAAATDTSVERSPARAMSLREALAGGATEAPPPDSATTQFPAAAPFTGLDNGTTRSTRLREPVVSPWVDDEPKSKGKKGKPGKDKRPRADKSARKAAQKAERRRKLRRQLSIPVPELKAPPSATIVTAVGAAVAGLVLVAVISVVVSRGSTHHVPSNDTVSSSTDACAVVDSGMATAAFGQDAGPPHFVLDSCVYDDGTHELIVAVYRTNGRALFDAGRSSQAQDIPGIGDGSYYVDGRLRVLKGNSLLLVTLGPIPATTPNPKLVTLASTAAGRL